MKRFTVDDLVTIRNLELPSSEWQTIDQSMINSFADITQDHQFIHVDPERTRRTTDLSGTIAHGFLTLSLLSAMAEDSMPQIVGAVETLNYGINNLRFLSPVPSGSRIKAHFKLMDSRLKDEGRMLLRYSVNIEIEGVATPAIAAEWLVLVVYDVEPKTPKAI